MIICNKQQRNITKILLDFCKSHNGLRNSESLGISRKLHTHIAHLKRYKHLFNSLAHVGAGHKNTRSRRVHWEDINSPVRLTKQKLSKHVNLLIIQNKYWDERGDGNDMDSEFEIKYHFCWIKNLSRLVSSQLSKRTRYFNSEQKLNDHVVDCSKLNNCKITFPEERALFFKNHKYKISTPFVIYADFEAMLEPLSEESSTKSTKYQKHTAFSVGYYFKCSYDDNLSFYKSHRGADCVQWFSNELETISKFIDTKLTTVVPMNMSQVQEMEFRLATICHICEKPFKDTEDHKKTRDHNHLTVPIVLHNLSNYDGHFIISEVAKTGSIYLLPINKERFLAESLDKLSSYLTNNELLNLRKEFHDLDDGKFKLLTRKGVTQLPDQEEFYNKLMDNNISDEDYRHAQNIWNKFEIKNLDLYLKTDVLLLADVFENFRQKCLNTYKLDPAHYYTLPGYTWDCMLKYTKVELDYIKDIDMLMFIERGIRGGVSQCPNRYAKANNKYIPNFDSTQPVKYLTYFDVNNLYGWAMSQYLPYADFRWVDTNIDVLNISDESDQGYILELMNNAVFGKTMENIRKHRVVKLKNQWEGRYGASNYIASPNFHSRAIFNNNLVAIELNKSEICFNKALFVAKALLNKLLSEISQKLFIISITSKDIDRV
ncbi:hypothetical protein NQ315_016583 [Exocentrus adspersus]|uniref:DNA-directed DNA polymerase n=1 Tax=Exocentrus adspersus TaxID=1586481 RepID=A0AAV8VD61_9CUCU|nr:hypothetical protein NQ315_016583 [Exocentrus adspersus]